MLSGPDRRILSVLSRLTDLFRLTSHTCPAPCSVSNVLSRLSCHDCSAIAIPSRLCSFPAWLVAKLQYPDCLHSCPPFFALPGCPVLVVVFWLSSPGCPVPAELSSLSCSSNIVPSSPVPAVLSLLSYHGRPFLSVPSRLTCQAKLSRLRSGLSCPEYPVMAILRRLYRAGCPVRAVLSWLLSCPRRINSK
jgi:hypothetical protein